MIYGTSLTSSPPASIAMFVLEPSIEAWLSSSSSFPNLQFEIIFKKIKMNQRVLTLFKEKLIGKVLPIEEKQWSQLQVQMRD